MVDREIRAALEELPLPPEPPGFFDALWQAAEARERVAARRWRGISVVLAVATIAAGSAAGVLAVSRSSGGTTTVDRTISCPVITQLDSGSIGFSAQVKEPPVSYNGGTVTQPGEIGAGSGNQITYAGASSEMFANGKTIKAGYFFNTTPCKSAPAIPLSRSGLPSLGVFSRAGNTELFESCSVAANSSVTVRLRVVLSGPDAPIAAQLAIRAGKRQRPLAFINWTPTRFTALASAACQQR